MIMVTCNRFGTVSDNGYKGLGKRAPPTVSVGVV